VLGRLVHAPGSLNIAAPKKMGRGEGGGHQEKSERLRFYKGGGKRKKKKTAGLKGKAFAEQPRYRGKTGEPWLRRGEKR